MLQLLLQSAQFGESPWQFFPSVIREPFADALVLKNPPSLFTFFFHCGISAQFRDCVRQVFRLRRERDQGVDLSEGAAEGKERHPSLAGEVLALKCGKPLAAECQAAGDAAINALGFDAHPFAAAHEVEGAFVEIGGGDSLTEKSFPRAAVFAELTTICCS